MPRPSSDLVVGEKLLRLPARYLRHAQGRKGETTRALIHRQMMTILARIDTLPAEADRETRRAWEMMVEAATSGLARAMERVDVELAPEARWRAILDAFVGDLRGRHGDLNVKAAELARRMIDVGPKALGVDLPAVVPYTVRGELAPTALYDGILHRWQFGKPAREATDGQPARPAIPSMRDAIAGIVDLARRGEIGLHEGMIRAKEELGLAREDAARLMRTGVGAAQAGGSQQRLEEIDEVTVGLLKVWWSALAVNTRPWHRRTHNQKRPVAEHFVIRTPKRGGGTVDVEMLHPLDPAGGAINYSACQCSELADVSGLQVRASLALR